jgi:hypothetical protein
MVACRLLIARSRPASVSSEHQQAPRVGVSGEAGPRRASGQVIFLGDATRSLGDAKSLLGDTHLGWPLCTNLLHRPAARWW